MSTIYQIYGQDAHEMTRKLLEAAGAIRLVPHGGSVALKPNLVISGTPESGTTTHAGMLSGCIVYFREHGVQDISVIEGSWVGDKTMRAMRRAGYDKVCPHYGVPFFNLKKDAMRSVKTPIGDISICTRALDAGLLVDQPVLKGHCQTRMTCALKNLKGCLPVREKRRFHALGLQKSIAALRPRLIVVDSICGDLYFEEDGTPVHINRMYLGTDAVQLDAYGCALMGFSPDEVPYIALAQQYGGGRVFPPQRHGRRAGARVAHQQEEIYIDQGWQGQTLPSLGIGKCCRSAFRCVMGCPPTAKQIAKALEME